MPPSERSQSVAETPQISPWLTVGFCAGFRRSGKSTARLCFSEPPSFFAFLFHSRAVDFDHLILGPMAAGDRTSHHSVWCYFTSCRLNISDKKVRFLTFSRLACAQVCRSLLFDSSDLASPSCHVSANCGGSAFLSRTSRSRRVDGASISNFRDRTSDARGSSGDVQRNFLKLTVCFARTVPRS